MRDHTDMFIKKKELRSTFFETDSRIRDEIEIILAALM